MRGHCDIMVVGFTTTCAISAYHHLSWEFASCSWWSTGVLDTTLCDKLCQWLATGQRFSPVSSTNKTDHHNITEILLKVVLNTINLCLVITIKNSFIYIYIYMDVVEWSRVLDVMVLQCINGVGSNPVEGRTKIWQL